MGKYAPGFSNYIRDREELHEIVKKICWVKRISRSKFVQDCVKEKIEQLEREGVLQKYLDKYEQLQKVDEE